MSTISSTKYSIPSYVLSGMISMVKLEEKSLPGENVTLKVSTGPEVSFSDTASSRSRSV